MRIILKEGREIEAAVKGNYYFMQFVDEGKKVDDGKIDQAVHVLCRFYTDAAGLQETVVWTWSRY